MNETTLSQDHLAFEPQAHAERYDGLRSRRIFAFLIDVAIISLLMLAASLVIAAIGLVTFGLGWFLFPFIWPLVAIAYETFTLGGPHGATLGMRMTGVRMYTHNGGAPYPLLALTHTVLFWLSVTVLSPLVLIVSLFSERKRLLHDMVLGTLIVRES